MESDNIKKLLEKYFEATTTVAEEKTLRDYFNQEKVAPSLERYAPMFTYFSAAKKERFTKQVPLKTRSSHYKWISVAAVAVLAFGIYFGLPSEPTLEDQYTQEEIASAQAALAMFTDNFSKGTEQISHLAEFEKNTNKFLAKQNQN